MRLTTEEAGVIKSIVKEFDPRANVRLFGSRVDDTKKGGDIDILIVSDKIGFDEKLDMKLRLYEKVGERKIDIIIYQPENSFHRLAYEESVELLTDIQVEVLNKSLLKAEKAAARLEESSAKVGAVIHKKSYSSSELETLESFSARFARLSDLLVK